MNHGIVREYVCPDTKLGVLELRVSSWIHEKFPQEPARWKKSLIFDHKFRFYDRIVQRRRLWEVIWNRKYEMYQAANRKTLTSTVPIPSRTWTFKSETPSAPYKEQINHPVNWDYSLCSNKIKQPAVKNIDGNLVVPLNRHSLCSKPFSKGLGETLY